MSHRFQPYHMSRRPFEEEEDDDHDSDGSHNSDSSSSDDDSDDEEVLYTHYRKCTLGMTLNNTLEQLEHAGKIDQDLKRETLEQFDKSMYKALKEQTKNRASLKGDIHMYRSTEGVLLFLCSRLDIKLDAQKRMVLDGGRIVAIEDMETKSESKAKKRKRSDQ